jgi:cytochrome c peroxidase
MVPACKTHVVNLDRKGRRDTDPKRWYPFATATGAPRKFDDLPSMYQGNVDVIDRPLTLHEGEAPVWSDAEIEDVIAFLRTLTDRDAQAVGVDRL